MSVIEVKNLSKRFGRKQALSEVSLRVERGEMVALIGASGSGKSTLIRHIAGLECGDRNGSSIAVLGKVLQSDGRLGRDARRIRREIGVVFQQFNLAGRLPVITNVLTGTLGRIPKWRGTLGLFSREEKHAAIQALDRVGVHDVAWQRTSTLSGGQQQRAAIARTLLQRSRVLLADEPIASLDPSSARRVMDVLAALNRDDAMTVIVSLHQVEYARRYCRRTVALRDGRIVFDGPSTALTPELLTELYGTASEELVLPDHLPTHPAGSNPAAPPIPSRTPGDLVPA